MKSWIVRCCALTVILVLGLTLAGVGAPAAVQAQAPTDRPIMILKYYEIPEGAASPGGAFTLKAGLFNTGTATARNVVVVFESTDFFPTQTGGVQASPEVMVNNHFHFTQPFVASTDLWGRSVGTITLRVSYASETGDTYNETFVVTVGVRQPRYNPPTPTPTTTPMPMLRPQLVVESYQTSSELQPGSIFQLKMKVHNLGNADAMAVTLVLGGGSIPNDQGTPTPGGFSGSGDLSNFAPLGTSNLVYLDDIAPGEALETSPQLIVNSTTQPGAYPFKLSFIYVDKLGRRIQDDQVITLLVYQLPQIEISFYRAPDMLFVGQMGTLPLQVTNLGRKSAVLGNLIVTSGAAEVTNNVSLVGALEPGGFFTLDASVAPFQPGPLEIQAAINYTDDFNQNRTILAVLTLYVEDIIIEPTPEFPDGNGNEPPPVTEEDFGQKLIRFLLGLIGLDSAPPQSGINIPIVPPDGGVIPPIIEPGGKDVPPDGGKW